MKTILDKCRVEDSTYLLLCIALLAGYFKNISILLLIIGVHEVGHIFFFTLFKIEIEEIVFYPFGGVTKINKKIHERIYKDFFCAIGGILFQLLLYIPIYFLFKYGYLKDSTYTLFLLYNKSILLFNLIPIIPLDGSKALFCLLTKYFSFIKSYITMIIIGTITLVIFILYNLIFKLNDICIYGFLILKLIEVIKNYKYVLNKFYLERILYDHYYNKIIHNCPSIKELKVDKYYYFKEHNHIYNEKEYIKKTLF